MTWRKCFPGLVGAAPANANGLQLAGVLLVIGCVAFIVEEPVVAAMRYGNGLGTGYLVAEPFSSAGR